MPKGFFGLEHAHVDEHFAEALAPVGHLGERDAMLLFVDDFAFEQESAEGLFAEDRVDVDGGALL